MALSFPNDYINKIICGDCLKVMPNIPDNSIDTIITDPPYGLEFMGKDWDKLSRNLMNPNSKKDIERKAKYGKNYAGRCSNLPDLSQLNKYGYEMQQWHYNWATEALRVAKPGATLLCFGGARTYHRLACAIEDAGWILKDCIMYLYGSGFPKATDISKQMDKRARVKREVIGKRKGTYADIRRDKNTGIAELHGGIATEKERIESYVTAPATPEATLWNGWKSHGLKPAYEPILVAMKPNEGSYANNALKWGVAGLNIDGGRIDYQGQNDINRARGRKGEYKKMGVKSNLECNVKITEPLYKSEISSKGRFPANLIIDDSLEVKKEFDKYKTSGNSYRPTGSRGKGIINGNIPFNKGLKRKGAIVGFNDSGSASRFFYCAKASKAERNRGCEGPEKKIIPMGGHGNMENDPVSIKLGSKRLSKNNHPCVKPLSLMKYLVTLTMMPNKDQIYLDPFCGSGTTLMACKELKRDYIGIDNKPEYCEIARKRINAIPESLF